MTCPLVTKFAEFSAAYQVKLQDAGWCGGEPSPMPESHSTLCGDEEKEGSLITQMYAGVQEFIGRTGAEVDPSYPDPGAPPQCGYNNTYLTKVTDFTSHLNITGGPPVFVDDYRWTLVNNYVAGIPSSIWMQVSVGLGCSLYAKRWTNAQLYMKAPYSSTFVPTGNPATSVWHDYETIMVSACVVSWMAGAGYGGYQWYWQLSNDDTNCGARTPIRSFVIVISGGGSSPTPYNWRESFESDYSPTDFEVEVPNDAFSQPGSTKYLYVRFDPHTADDKIQLQWSDPNLNIGVWPFDSGFVSLGNNEYKLVLPQASDVPAGTTLQVTETSQDPDNWHSGWELDFESNN